MPGWVRYDNDCERRKRTTREFGPAGRELVGWLTGPAFLSELRTLTGIPDLQPDPLLHGAGIHVTDPGGYLQSHLDYALHPTLGLERRINLVLFLNAEWREHWGGATELYHDNGETVAAAVHPQPGRAVLWECSDFAYHGAAVTARERVTLAVYYLAPPRPGVTRKRALFVPRRS